MRGSAGYRNKDSNEAKRKRDEKAREVGRMINSTRVYDKIRRKERARRNSDGEERKVRENKNESAKKKGNSIVILVNYSRGKKNAKMLNNLHNYVAKIRSSERDNKH